MICASRTIPKVFSFFYFLHIEEVSNLYTFIDNYNVFLKILYSDLPALLRARLSCLDVDKIKPFHFKTTYLSVIKIYFTNKIVESAKLLRRNLSEIFLKHNLFNVSNILP